MVSADSSLHADLDYKLDAARRAFYSSKDQLMCKDVGIKTRLLLLRRMVASVLLWCTETWHATSSVIDRLDGFYTGLVVRMLQWKKASDDTLHDFIVRRRQHARYLLSVTTGTAAWMLYCR
eukprot:8723084-Karenia_brevis.AAC.1